MQGRPLVLAGIANPQYLMQYVQHHFSGAELMAFPDHHRFTSADTERILSRAAAFDFVLTTEKDLVSMQGTPLYDRLASRLQAIPIEVDLGDDLAALEKQITTYIQETKNRCASSRS